MDMRDRLRVVFVVLVGASGCFRSAAPLTENNLPVDGGGADGVDALPSTCRDGTLDGNETDVDCGGSCPRCAAGQHCVSASDCVSGNCSADTNTCSAHNVVSFADAVSYPADFKPYVMLSADLDGDGNVDLAVANEEGDTITAFRNLGNNSGTFLAIPASTRDGFPTGEYPTGGAIADFNRDGIPDVITANFHGESVSILLGSGTGSGYTLMPPANYPAVTGGETSNLAVGDLNGDGIPDVIATNPQASSISVFIASADGTLGPASNVAIGVAGQSQPYSVAIGDFDGDGHADAAVADNYSASMFIELGNGDGTFHLAPSQPAIGGVQSFIVIASDMNLDGKLDLIVANRSSDDISVLINRGDGSFQTGLVSSTGSNTGPYSLAVADFDHDGLPDVVTADYLSNTASVLLGRGDGTFIDPMDAGNMGQLPYGIAVGDFDGDGKPDFATANALSDDMTVKLNTSP